MDNSHYDSFSLSGHQPACPVPRGAWLDAPPPRSVKVVTLHHSKSVDAEGGSLKVSREGGLGFWSDFFLFA